MFRKKKELEVISEILEDMLKNQPLKLDSLQEDTLSSKIQFQLLRLSDQMRGERERITKERDDIKELISDIAHQLRNPLGNIEGYLSLLMQSDVSEKERESYLQAIQVSEQRLHFLTDGFIKMARLEHKMIQIKKESTDVSATILKSILQVQSEAEKKEMEIQLDLPKKIQILHDTNWLGEAIYNVLDNSVKYSNHGSVICITVTSNDMFSKISIQDEGIGIEEGEENRIFQRFYRGERTTVQEGFGLGLYLTREIVLQHEGFIKAKRKKKGLDISIYLPSRITKVDE
ncbi:MAG: sensor histidine kinase [Lachnospiraceae bacterium]